MTTIRRGLLVSLVATTIITVALGCARAPSQPMRQAPSPMDARPFTIRFDNDASQHVHVYLVGETRQWLLGRVEPGARASLRIPEESLAGDRMFARLAVVTGEGVTLQPARHPRATVTVWQPATAILSQRWSFVQGALTSLRR